MKKIFCVIIAAVVLALSGCSRAVTASDMPEIVFMKFTKYYRGIPFNESSDEGKYSLEFLDKNGDFYITYSYEICTLYENELIEKFKSGDDRIKKLPKSRDAGEILANYKKLLKVSSNKKYELEYLECLPAVMDDDITWYGLYYDKDGNLLSLPIHAWECMTPIEANDDRANEIYKWYSNSANSQ